MTPVRPEDVGRRVEIVIAAPNESHLLHKRGRLLMVADDVNSVVELDDGSAATVKIDQLSRID